MILTRPKELISRMSQSLSDLGAEVIELPSICLKPYEENSDLLKAMKEIKSYQWLVFMYLHPHEGSSVPVCSSAQYQMQPPSSGLHILSLPEPGQIPRKIPVFSISTTLFIWAIYPLLTSTAGTVHEEVSDTSTLHLPHHPVVQTDHGIRRLSAES